MKNNSLLFRTDSLKLLTLIASNIPFLTATFAQKRNMIDPGAVWPDDQGNHIQAHGGGIIKQGDTYSWYGEERRKGLDTNYRFVSCYSSKDAMNCKFRGEALKLSKPATELSDRGWVLERPKVYYNNKTKTYLMYMRLADILNVINSGGYGYARVGVAV